MTAVTIAHRGREAIGSPGDLSHLRLALPVDVNFADAFDPREHVINRLAPHPDELASDDPGHEIARQIENLPRRPAVEPFAQDGGHRPGQGLHFRAERHPKMRFPGVIDLEVNTDGIRAFLVFPNVFERERFAGARLLFLRVVRVGNESLAPLYLGQRFEKVNDGF